jgi:hypothetical protein
MWSSRGVRLGSPLCRCQRLIADIWSQTRPGTIAIAPLRWVAGTKQGSAVTPLFSVVVTTAGSDANRLCEAYCVRPPARPRSAPPLRESSSQGAVGDWEQQLARGMLS